MNTLNNEGGQNEKYYFDRIACLYFVRYAVRVQGRDETAGIRGLQEGQQDLHRILERSRRGVRRMQ